MDQELINKILPLILSALAPVIVGLLQQMSKVVKEKAPWYLKSILTMLIGAAISYITTKFIGVEPNAVAAMTTGAAMGAVGSVNIALRRGPSREGIA